MKSKTFLLVMPAVMVLLLVGLLTDAYGHGGHSHGSGGGGCDNCTPPTLGVDSSGMRKVSGGLSVNGQLYDVELFKQELESQSLEVGTTTEIILKIFDEGGYATLKHVELGLGYDEKFVSGVMVPYNHVSIEWDKTFDGKTSIIINDPEDLLKDVSVDVLDNNPVIGFKFKFTPTQGFDANTIVTKVWDTHRNVNTNYFYNVFEIEYDQPTISLLASEQEQTIPSFDEKTRESLMPSINYDVQCMVGQKQLLRVSNMIPLCVDAYQAEVLLSKNWAIPSQ